MSSDDNDEDHDYARWSGVFEIEEGRWHGVALVEHRAASFSDHAPYAISLELVVLERKPKSWQLGHPFHPQTMCDWRTDAVWTNQHGVLCCILVHHNTAMSSLSSAELIADGHCWVRAKTEQHHDADRNTADLNKVASNF